MKNSLQVKILDENVAKMSQNTHVLVNILGSK